MAKSGRKRKKAEKSKIQLKKGKKSLRLPKGLNETDSRVTTKKIQVANQLGQSEPTGEPVSKKNISLKDLLNKLNSQSGSIRIDGLDGLAEILKGEHSVALLESSLSLMIHKLSPLTNDNEGKVRKLAITVLGQVIRQTNVSEVFPFFPILNAHLCCGLSHIDPIVQRDSLRMLDEFIFSLPLLIKRNFPQILPNCLNLFSTKKSSQDNRTLSSNVSERISSLQLRQEVLDRIHKTFQIVVESHDKNGSREKIGSKNFDIFYMKMKWPETSNNILTMVDLQNDFVSRNFWQDSSSKNGLQNNDWVDNVVRLLLETWSEALLSTSNSKPDRLFDAGKPISPEILPILHSCLKSLTLLIKFSKSSDTEDENLVFSIHEVHKSKMVEKILQKFPYQLLKQKRQKNEKIEKKESERSEHDIVQFNIEMAEMWIYLSENLDKEAVDNILSYLTGLVNQQNCNSKLATQVSEVLLQIARRVIPKESIDCFKSLVHEISRRYPSNLKLVELYGVILSSTDHLHDFCPEGWILNLAETIKKGSANSAQRNVAKQLLKRNHQSFTCHLPPTWNYLELNAS